MGRGINVPNFGVFTFTAPEIVLNVRNFNKITLLRIKNFKIAIFKVHLIKRELRTPR